jgi:hypothetical protein
MTSRAFESFAKKFGGVMDVAIRDIDTALRAAKTDNGALMAKRWSALFHLLDAVDNGRIRLQYEDESGEKFDLGESQELGGWFAGGSPDSWRQLFSKERIEPEAPAAPKKPKSPKKLKR